MFSANGRKFELPLFMPVATKLSAKLISLREIEGMGFSTVICNSFLLYLDPGIELIKKSGGMRRFTGTNLNFFSDSGGFQMISDLFLDGINEKGLRLRSPYDKKVHLITPEKSMEIQSELGGDVVMCLDYMPRYGDKKKDIERSVELTFQWAKRCRDSYSGEGKLFGIIQGGTFKDLRKKSAELITSLDLDGYAIGGLGIGEGKDKMFSAVEDVIKLLPKNKPKYLMGIGSPDDVRKFMNLGVDIFDSAYPTRVGRHGLIFSDNGNIEIDNKKFRDDFRKIDEKCGCETCKNFSRAYLHHLVKIKEPLAKRLMSMHNLFFMKKLIG